MENQNAAKTFALAASSSNKKLAAEIAASGATVISFPQIETEKALLDEKSNAFLNDLTEFDWLIFFDVFAADYFLQQLEENEKDFFELDALRVCALGEAVADRLRFVQVHADVVPNSSKTDAIVAALAAYIGEGEIGGKCFLAIKRRTAAETEIENALKEKGAVVSELEIYRARISAAAGETARLKALLAGGAIDEFVFTAPADFIALEELAAQKLLAEILRETKISATDEVTLRFLRERDLNAAPFRRK